MKRALLLSWRKSDRWKKYRDINRDEETKEIVRVLRNRSDWKAISGLIARILIDIFDSSPGEEEEGRKGKFAVAICTNRWHIDISQQRSFARDRGYLHRLPRVIKFQGNLSLPSPSFPHTLAQSYSFKLERELYRTRRRTNTSFQLTMFSGCYLGITFKRKISPRFFTSVLSRSSKNRSSKRIS